MGNLFLSLKPSCLHLFLGCKKKEDNFSLIFSIYIQLCILCNCRESLILQVH